MNNEVNSEARRGEEASASPEEKPASVESASTRGTGRGGRVAAEGSKAQSRAGQGRAGHMH